MKFILSLLAGLLPLAVFADDIVVTAKVNDRALDGSPIRGQYKYPTVELESGENASLHIGENLRYPVWIETVELEEGMTKEETAYEETPVGFVLGIKVAERDGVITYSGKAVSTLVNAVTAKGSSLSSTDATFLGKAAEGEMVEVSLIGPGGVEEVLVLHFSLKD